MKTCTKCNVEKELIKFYWEKKRQRYKTTCISCEKEKCLKRYKDNPEKVKAINKKWIENNKEKFKQLIKNNRGKYKEYDKQYAKNYTQQNSEKIKQKQKEWRLNNPNYYKEKRKKERQILNEYHNNYNKNRRKNDIKFRIKQCVSSNINFNIRKYKKSKSNSTVKYLGCSIKEYIVYLENMFLNEMSWENYGIVWEIDHITPISLFDFSIEESFGYTDQIGNRNKLNKI